MRINNKIIYGLLVLSCVGSLVLSWKFRTNTITLEDERTHLQEKVSKAEQEYNKKKIAIRNQYYEYASVNGTQLTKIIGTQGTDVQQLSKIATNFFEIYYDYADSKSYNARKNKLSKFTDDKILNDSMLFSSDSELIDTLGARSTFKSCEVYYRNSNIDEINGTVSVNYTFGYSNSVRKEGTQIYLVTYNKKNSKITEVQKLN